MAGWPTIDTSLFITVSFFFRTNKGWDLVFVWLSDSWVLSKIQGWHLLWLFLTVTWEPRPSFQLSQRQMQNKSGWDMLKGSLETVDYSWPIQSSLHSRVLRRAFLIRLFPVVFMPPLPLVIPLFGWESQQSWSSWCCCPWKLEQLNGKGSNTKRKPLFLGYGS